MLFCFIECQLDGTSIQCVSVEEGEEAASEHNSYLEIVMQERTNGLKSRSVTARRRQTTPQPVLAVRQRRQLQPFFFSMGPVALSITSVLLIGLMALLYISQVGQAVGINHTLQDVRTEQSSLQRQNQDMTSTIAQEQSPGYIATKARQMGLTPLDPKSLWILKTADIQQSTTQDPDDQP